MKKTHKIEHEDMMDMVAALRIYAKEDFQSDSMQMRIKEILKKYQF